MTFKLAQTNLVRRRTALAMTLVELMIGIGVGSIVLAVVSVLTVFGARSFVTLGNYSILEQQSTTGIDQITRELRQASRVVAWQTNSLPKWLLVTNMNGYTVKYSLDSDRQLVMRKSNEGEDKVLIEGCDSWNFSLWKGAPQTNGFYLATTAADCKMISMTWKCSRFIAGTNSMNTEAAQTAQIVLRNKK
jgi:hypothetical protein